MRIKIKVGVILSLLRMTPTFFIRIRDDEGIVPTSLPSLILNILAVSFRRLTRVFLPFYVPSSTLRQKERTLSDKNPVVKMSSISEDRLLQKYAVYVQNTVF
jgi:hypothetical protein